MNKRLTEHLRLFWVNSGVTLTLRNLTLRSGRATGGGGSFGGGGGAGMGGAVFVDHGTLNIEDCEVENCAAQGGSGGQSNATGIGGSGGGGMKGKGGQGSNFGGGGGGGGTTGDGADTTSATGGAGGTANGGNGGNNGQAGGAGGFGGGGGGGGGNATGTGSPQVGGAGGFAGGGGGGGGNAATVNGAAGGAGGFGAGGGGGGNGNTSPARAGGAPGSPGFGGGNAAAGIAAVGGAGGGGAGMGGAIFNYSGTVTLLRTSFINNDATGGAGGGGNSGPNAGNGGSGLGGAIFNYLGTLGMTNCTLGDNTATGGGGGAGVFTGGKGGNGGNGEGGGIYNYDGDLTLLNVTCGLNSCVAGLKGTGLSGAVDGDSDGTTAAPDVYDHDVTSGTGSFTADNTILGSTTGGTSLVTEGNALSGANNIIRSATGATTGLAFVTSDPLLDAPADNGGAGQTMALQTGSPAINAGNDSLAPSTDQRGLPRSGVSDIGAYEVQGATTTPTTTTLGSSVNPSVYGQSITLTATVTAATSGQVTFKDGTATLGTGNVNASGIATLTTTSLSVGSHSLTAEYQGTSSFDPSTSTALSQQVNKAATTVGLALPGATVFGQSILLSATVAAVAPGSGTPTGTVTFKEGANTLGSATLAAGTGSTSVSGLSVGPHSITAEYAGDGNFNGNSDSGSQTVNRASTAIVVGQSGATSTFGDSVTFTVAVTAVSPGAGTPTGLAEFFDGSASLGTASLNGSGGAQISTSSLDLGTHTISAAYGGDTNSDGSASSAITHEVQCESVAISADPVDAEVCVGQDATFTAAATGKPDPTVRWQVNKGNGFEDIPGATSLVLSVAGATEAMDGYLYRAVFTNDCSEVDTQAATLTVNAYPSVPQENQFQFGLYPVSDFVAASDGVFPNKVYVTWSEVPGAREYQVYRSLKPDLSDMTLVSDWNSNRFYTDYDVNEVQVGGIKCQRQVIPQLYFYQVKARGFCGETDLSSADTGFAKTSDSFVLSSLPQGALNAPGAKIGVTDAVSVRLTSNTPIATGDIWGAMSATLSPLEKSALSITSVSSDAENDYWVTYTPPAGWREGETVTMTVGTTGMDGKPANVLTGVFIVDGMSGRKAATPIGQPSYSTFDTSGLDLGAESMELVRMYPAVSSAPLAGAVGNAYTLSPDRPYSVPQRVWLPVPAGVNPDGVAVYCYDADTLTWVNGDSVLNWIVPGSQRILTTDQGVYFGVVVTSAAMVQLAESNGAQPAQASLAHVETGLAGLLELLALVTMLTLGHVAVRRLSAGPANPRRTPH